MSQAGRLRRDGVGKFLIYLRGSSASECMSQYEPHLIPELMAYMATIVRVNQDFEGLLRQSSIGRQLSPTM